MSGLLHSWSAYCLVATGAVGILLMQSAFNAGPLHASLPTITAGEPVAGILLGIVIFGDRISLSPASLATHAGGLAALVVGVILVARAPALSSLRQAVVEPVQRPVSRLRDTGPHRIFHHDSGSGSADPGEPGRPAPVPAEPGEPAPSRIPGPASAAGAPGPDGLPGPDGPDGLPGAAGPAEPAQPAARRGRNARFALPAQPPTPVPPEPPRLLSRGPPEMPRPCRQPQRPGGRAVAPVAGNATGYRRCAGGPVFGNFRGGRCRWCAGGPVFGHLHGGRCRWCAGGPVFGHLHGGRCRCSARWRRSSHRR